MGEIDDIEAFARANRRKRGIRFAILGLICASPFLWLTYNCQQQHARNAKWHDEERERNALSKEERAELDKLLPEIGTMIQTASKAFAEDVTPAKLAEVVPGDERCGRRIERYGYVSVKPGEQPKAAGLTSAAESLADLEQQIKNSEDGATKWHLERAHGLAHSIDETVIFVGERTAPVMMVDSYIPGQVRGTAYVYSSRARKVVCVGDITVENSAEIAFEYTTSRYDVTGAGNKNSAAQAKLEADLSERTAKAISSELRQPR
ncbi:MAG: hypothetical protein ABI175_12005 [Polyangiales bacterium]